MGLRVSFKGELRRNEEEKQCVKQNIQDEKWNDNEEDVDDKR